MSFSDSGDIYRTNTEILGRVQQLEAHAWHAGHRSAITHPGSGVKANTRQVPRQSHKVLLPLGFQLT